jgi:pyrroline-5-carboxylate reductase
VRRNSFDELVVVGGGNMGSALIGGWLRDGVPASAITVVEAIEIRQAQLRKEFPRVKVLSEIPKCHSVLVAVKPAGVANVVREAVAQGARRVVSIAAGVSSEQLAEAAGPDVLVLRSMPNTPALVGKGVTALCTNRFTSETLLNWGESLFASVGEVVRVPETAIDVYTGLIGSGPAYLFHVAEALAAAGADLGAEIGLSPEVIHRAVEQLFVGSAALLASGQGTPGELREKVTSPNGTTAAGLQVLYNSVLADALRGAVQAAAARSAEMTRELDAT